MRKFDKNEFFCKKCMIHDTFFVGGGSWAPECCPKCKGTDCTAYRNLSFMQRIKAKKLFDEMWQELRIAA